LHLEPQTQTLENEAIDIVLTITIMLHSKFSFPNTETCSLWE
jgi:hypothetical protein